MEELNSRKKVKKIKKELGSKIAGSL